jgi:hypothetical protein
LPFTADSASNRRLTGTNAARSIPAAALIPVPIFSFPANERLINLDNTDKLAKFLVLHSRSDAMTHVPSRPVGAGADHAVNLEGTNSFLAGQHEVDRAEPRLERHIRVFEHGADRDREPIAIPGTISTLPIERLVMRSVGHFIVATAWAAHTIRPTLADEIGATGFLIREQCLKLRDGHLLGDLGLLGAGHDGLPLSVGGYCHV